MMAAVKRVAQPLSGTFHNPGRESVGSFALAYDAWIFGMIERHKPDGILFEAPILPARTTPATVRKLMGLAVLTQMAAKRARIGWLRECQPQSMKSHVSGYAPSGKAGVQDALIAMGWHFGTADEADALGLWLYADSLYRSEVARR